MDDPDRRLQQISKQMEASGARAAAPAQPDEASMDAAIRSAAFDAQRNDLDRLLPAQRQTALEGIGRVQGNRHALRVLATSDQTPSGDAGNGVQPKEMGAPGGAKLGSARFGGDKTFERIAAGTKTLKKGDSGIAVVKLQQALIDAGYPLPKFGVDQGFGDELETVLKKFQTDAKIPDSGKLDKATLDALNKLFDTRKPYLDNATLDPLNPSKGTRALKANEQKAATAALVPVRGAGGTPSTFQDVVAGKTYADDMKVALTAEIARLHKKLFADKKPLRADPAKNFEKWSVLEGAADASKDVTDQVYGTYAKGPKMTQAAGNFVDQWEDEIVRNSALNPTEQKRKARSKVWYLIVSNCTTVSELHSAVPTDTKEKGKLTPLVETFIDTPAKVQTMLELDIGWEGAQLEGVVYLQRYKEASDVENRKLLWKLFQICIHEYIHSLAHKDFKAYAEAFRTSGDEARYNTLTEGFDELFTLSVRKTVKVTDPLRKKIEGPYYDAKAAAPSVGVGVYPSVAQAEQVTAIVGIRNAAAAYFQGKVGLIGKK